MEDLPVLYVYSKTPPPNLQIFVVIEPSPEVLFVVKHVYTVTIKFFFSGKTYAILFREDQHSTLVSSIISMNFLFSISINVLILYQFTLVIPVASAYSVDRMSKHKNYPHIFIYLFVLKESGPRLDPPPPRGTSCIYIVINQKAWAKLIMV